MDCVSPLDTQFKQTYHFYLVATLMKSDLGLSQEPNSQGCHACTTKPAQCSFICRLFRMNLSFNSWAFTVPKDVQCSVNKNTGYQELFTFHPTIITGIPMTVHDVKILKLS